MSNLVPTRVGELAYSDIGEGPPVVLLHATLHDRHDYDAVLPALSRAYRVIAVDWPGHGDSPASRVSRGLSATSLADALADLVSELELPPAVLIGNSVGGFAAARLAICAPERVSGLVLVNTGGFFGGLPVKMYCCALGVPAVARLTLPRMIHGYMKAVSPNDFAVEERVVARARTRAGVDLAAGLWRSFATDDYDLRPVADRIAAPTLIVWGSQDTAIPLRFGRQTEAAIAGSRLELLTTGHVPFSSDPAGFLAITTPFLTAIHRSGTRQ